MPMHCGRPGARERYAIERRDPRSATCRRGAVACQRAQADLRGADRSRARRASMPAMARGNLQRSVARAKTLLFRPHRCAAKRRTACHHACCRALQHDTLRAACTLRTVRSFCVGETPDRDDRRRPRRRHCCAPARAAMWPGLAPRDRTALPGGVGLSGGILQVDPDDDGLVWRYLA